MTLRRNDILDALLTIGAGIPAAQSLSWTFKDTARKMGDYTTAQLPALWQIEGDDDYTGGIDGQLNRTEMQVTWVVVHGGGDQAVEPTRQSQDFKDAVDATLVNGVHIQTLGGRVFAAFIKGAIRRYAGDFDGYEMLVIPLTIIIP